MQCRRKSQSKALWPETAPALWFGANGSELSDSQLPPCQRAGKAEHPTRLPQAWNRKSAGRPGSARHPCHCAEPSAQRGGGAPSKARTPTQAHRPGAPPGLWGLGTGFIIAVHSVAVTHVHGKRQETDTGGGVSHGKECELWEGGDGRSLSSLGMGEGPERGCWARGRRQASGLCPEKNGKP